MIFGRVADLALGIFLRNHSRARLIGRNLWRWSEITRRSPLSGFHASHGRLGPNLGSLSANIGRSGPESVQATQFSPISHGTRQQLYPSSESVTSWAATPMLKTAQVLKDYQHHLSRYRNFEWCSNWDGKKYDIVFYGVSGYTGYLMMEYLKRVALKKTKEHFTFAFAGRTPSKVEEMRDREFRGTQWEDTPVMQMSYDDIFSVIDLVKSARVVINVAGPYMLTQGLPCALGGRVGPSRCPGVVQPQLFGFVSVSPASQACACATCAAWILRTRRSGRLQETFPCVTAR